MREKDRGTDTIEKKNVTNIAIQEIGIMIRVIDIMVHKEKGDIRIIPTRILEVLMIISDQVVEILGLIIIMIKITEIVTEGGIVVFKWKTTKFYFEEIEIHF